jgi:hypothetical protein
LTLSAQGGGDIRKALDALRNGARLLHQLKHYEIDDEKADTQLKMDEEQKRLEEKQQQQQAQEEEQKKLQAKEKEDSKNLMERLLDAELDDDTNQHANQNDNNAEANNNNGNFTDINSEIGKQLQNKLDAFDRRAKKTRIILLQKVASWAFDICSTGPKAATGNSNSSTPQESSTQQKKKIPKRNIDRNAFYTGILLVHLHLSKYVGVAACHPPTRDQIDELFELADQDRSGCLNEAEFTNAVVVACTPITSRIAVYWSLLAVLPLVVSRSMGWIALLMRAHIHKLPGSFYQKALVVLEWSIEHVFSLLFFSILVPNLFGKIDRATRERARQRSKKRSASTTLWWLRLQQPMAVGDDGNNKNSKQQPSWMKQWEDWVQSGINNGWSTTTPQGAGDEGAADAKKGKRFWRKLWVTTS